MASASLPIITCHLSIPDTEITVDMSEMESEIETAIEDAIRDDIDPCTIGNDIIDEFCASSSSEQRDRVIRAIIEQINGDPVLCEQFRLAIMSTP